MARPLRVGIVGAGPRGLTVLERLLAHGAGAHLDIHVFDPFPPGPGRVWRTDQPDTLLMNTVLQEQTVFPDVTCEVQCVGTGPSMAEWAEDPTPDGRFPRRREYGAYLAWAWRRLVDRAPTGVTITHHPCEVLRILDMPEAAAPRGCHERASSAAAQALRLDDGRTLEVDAVVLCVGHIPTVLSDERAEWRRFAESAGLVYLPPGLPAEAPVDRLRAGEPVLIRGFGLNWFDLQALLSRGRGGRFEVGDDPDCATGAAESDTLGLERAAVEGRLRYVPSGEEPLLVPGSRRGVPYRSKPITPLHPLPVTTPGPLVHFTQENVARLPARENGLRFDEQLWPLILADLRRAWYTTLARARPDAFRAAPSRLTDALTASVARLLEGTADGEAQRWHDTEARTLDPEALTACPDLVFDLHRFLRPLGDDGFASQDELRSAMLSFLRDDLAASLTGPELSPAKSLFPVLWQARALLKELVAQGRVEPGSFIAEVRGWFEDFVSGICDGPPPLRFAELIALAEAGVVDFAGPEVRIRTSRAGEDAGFVATTPAVGTEIRARALVDASSPANRVGHAGDRLIRGMLERGQLAVAEHRLDETTVVPSTGLAVTRAPYRPLDSHGRVHPTRFVLSLQLSSVQLGLAIAANPGTNARTLRDADAIARAILGLR